MSPALDELFSGLPEQLTHPFEPTELHAPADLYRGGIVIRDEEGDEEHLEGRFRWEWLPQPRVSFESQPLNFASPILFRTGRLSFEALDLPASGELFITRSGAAGIQGIVISRTWAGQDKTAEEVRFLVPNFCDYMGTTVRYENRDSVGAHAARITLTAEDWIVEIDETIGGRERRNEARASRGYGVAHVGRLRKAGGRKLQRTCTSSSRSLGLRTGPVLAIGLSTGEIACKRWRSPVLFPFARIQPHGCRSAGRVR